MDNTTIFMERLVKVQSDLTAFVFSLMPLRADNVQEVVQQTNLALVTLKDQYDPARPFKPWAFTFAKHQVQAFIRDHGRERVLFSSDLIDRVAELYDDGRSPAGGGDVQEDLLKRLATCRGKLKDPERLLLSLFYERRLPIKQMAQEVRMTPESIRVTLSRIRRKLGDCIRALCRLSEAEAAAVPRGAAGHLLDEIVEGSRTFPGGLVEEASRELAGMDDDTLRHYIDQFRVHTLLSGGLVAAPRRTVLAMSRGFRPRLFALAAAALVLVGGVWALVAVRSNRTVATVENVYCALDMDGKAVTVGTRLAPGEWRWANGLIELGMDHTRVIVETPAVIRTCGPSRLQLLSGKVVVRMEKGYDGFVVETPKIKVRDRGTEFGVSVEADGKTSVQVFDGEVLASSSSKSVQRTLRKGEAVASDADGGIWAVRLAPDLFIRRFPTPVPGAFNNAGFAFNTLHYSVMDAFPFATPPRIDGDLADWPTNVSFRSACDPPYDKIYTVEARVGYDATNLYLAVAVGDPDPMRNQNASSPGYAFAGGSVVFRLATDREPNPMRATYTAALGWTPNEEDANHLVSLVCFYDAVGEKAALWAHRGMSESGHRINGADISWTGVFRKRADGLGYVMEYAVPWSGIDSKPPAPGEVRAGTWNIHWSDAEGRICVGQLAENLVTFESEFPQPSLRCGYRCLPAWGRIVFTR